jgi:hypothetical protein
MPLAVKNVAGRLGAGKGGTVVFAGCPPPQEILPWYGNAYAEPLFVRLCPILGVGLIFVLRVPVET